MQPVCLKQSNARNIETASCWARIVVCCFTAAFAAPLEAQASDAGGQPTAMVSASANYFTYKSKLASSNDTGISENYGFGVFAGNEHEIGALLRGSMYTAKFALNKSSIAFSSQDFIFNYRFDWIYFGASAGTSSTKYVDASDTQMDAFSTTVGGNLGIIAPISKQSRFHLDVQAATALKTKEAQSRTVKIGMRIEADTGVSFAVYKHGVELLFGIRVVSQTLSANSQGGAEMITAPSLGVQFNL